MKSDCLNIKGLNVWYKKGKPIIKDTNLLVPNHSVVGLIGRNGAGKTTLLKALSSVFDHRQYAVETVTIEERRPLFIRISIRAVPIQFLLKTIVF